AQERAQMHERHEPAAQRRQPAHRAHLAGNVEHLGGVADFEHARDGQAVGLSFGADQEIALHLPLRFSNSALTRSAICPSGSTTCTPPACTAAFGMPAMIDVSLSWAMPVAPASRIARRPAAPSRPMPVSTTPTPRPA